MAWISWCACSEGCVAGCKAWQVAQVVLLLHVVLCHKHVRVILAAVTSQIILVFLGASVAASLQLVVVCVSQALEWQRSHAYARVVFERGGLRDGPVSVEHAAYGTQVCQRSYLAACLSWLRLWEGTNAARLASPRLVSWAGAA